MVDDEQGRNGALENAGAQEDGPMKRIALLLASAFTASTTIRPSRPLAAEWDGLALSSSLRDLLTTGSWDTTTPNGFRIAAQ